MTAVEVLRETTFDATSDGDALLRRLLEATAAPGRCVSVGDTGLRVPPPSLRLACALLLARLDREVSFTVLGLAARWVREYLRFNTGALITDVEAADFVLVTGPGPTARVDRVKRGRAGACPASATIVYAPTSLSNGPGAADATLVIIQPGGIAKTRLNVRGIRSEELDQLASHEVTRPGVDIWLASADGDLAVLPRSARWRREA